jgi:hypothetical protein
MTEYFKIQEIANLEFDRLYTKTVIVDVIMGAEHRKCKAIIELKSVGLHKHLSVSSEMSLVNNTSVEMEVRLHMKSNESYNIPIGYEGSVMQFRASTIAQWSPIIDLARVIAQPTSSTYDLP